MTKHQTREVLTALTAADVFRLLAACFYQPEREMFIEERLGEHLVEAVQGAFPEAEDLALQLADALRTSSQEELLLDYARLFLGPFEIISHPYGSVYLDGEKVVMGNSTMQLRDLYRQAGFEVAEDIREVPDHIAIELEFLYLLIFLIGQANSDEESNRLQALKCKFLSAHLGKWVGPFAEAVRKGAESNFYRLLADLTEQLVFAERHAVAEAV